MKRNKKLKIEKSAIRNPQSAFTLIELMVVILILGILIALSTGAAFRLIDNADRKHTISVQKTILDAIKEYRDDTGLDMSTGNDISVLFDKLAGNIAAQKTVGKLPEEAIDSTNKTFLDAYDRAMYYFDTAGFGGTPRLLSYGKDGAIGGGDDIYSDKE